MRLIPIGTFVALAAALAGPALAADAPALVAAKRQLQTAVSHAKAAEILAARAAFARLLASDPRSADLNYWTAVAAWRAVPLLQNADKEEAKRICKDGIAACDRAIAADPRHADAIALRAGLQGMSLWFASPMAGMTLGPEMEEAYGRAQGIDPDNPRVALLKAIGTLNKPAFVGGGADKARPQLEGTIALYEKAAPRDSAAIDWGRDDAYVWTGQCLGKLGDWKGARERYRQALEINPDNAWAKYVLLPAAEKQLAGAEPK